MIETIPFERSLFDFKEDKDECVEEEVTEVVAVLKLLWEPLKRILFLRTSDTEKMSLLFGIPIIGVVETMAPLTQPHLDEEVLNIWESLFDP